MRKTGRKRGVAAGDGAIRERRLAAGLSCAEVAAVAGLDASTVARAERGVAVEARTLAAVEAAVEAASGGAVVCGARLAAMRERAGLSREVLAAGIGVSRQTLYYVEMRGKRPSKKIIAAAVRYINGVAGGNTSL